MYHQDSDVYCHNSITRVECLGQFRYHTGIIYGPQLMAWSQTLQLGRIVLRNRLILAPLEGVSDAAFRRICFNNGAALTFSEMVRGAAIVRNNKATLDLIDSFDEQIPTGLQLLVPNATVLLAALTRIEHLSMTTHRHFRNISVIDLNFGCPSKDVIAAGCGPVLLKRHTKMQEIFNTLADWKSKTKLSIGAVGAKIRLGLNAQEQQHKVSTHVW